MRNSIVLFFSVTCVTLVSVLAGGHLDDELEKMSVAHEECQSNPGTWAHEKMLDNWVGHVVDPHVRAHLLCEAQKVGLIDEDGELDIDNIKDKISLSVDDEKEVDNLVKKCAVQKEGPEETTAHLFVCLEKEDVTYFL